MNKQTFEQNRIDAAVKRELWRIERINESRIDDVEQAELAAHFRNGCLDKRKPALEAELREAGKWIETDSDYGWIEAAGRYIELSVGYDHDGRLKIFNGDLAIEGTYHRLAISYTSADEFARVDHGAEERRGPFCGTFGLASCLTSHRAARSPEITVTDGDVISINCRDFRVRVFRGQYIALDRIERDGTLTPQGGH